MPSSKRPVPQDAVTARRILITGLARDADTFRIVSELAPLHPRNGTLPGEVFLRLGADALDRCRASRADPLALEGIADRSCPSARSEAETSANSGSLPWQWRRCTEEPSRTCSTRSSGGRPTISGSTPCSQRLPISAPPPTGRVCPCARYARSYPSVDSAAIRQPARSLNVSGANEIGEPNGEPTAADVGPHQATVSYGFCS